MPFSLLFSVDSRLHTLFACCSTLYTGIVCADHPRLLRGFSAAITRILRGRYTDYPRRSARLSAAVRSEQPRNSAEKIKFSVSRTVSNPWIRRCPSAGMECLQKLCKNSTALPRSCGFEVLRCNVGAIFARCAMFVYESPVLF